MADFDYRLVAVHHAAAVKTRPGGMPTATRAAGLVSDEHPARFQPMAGVRAAGLMVAESCP